MRYLALIIAQRLSILALLKSDISQIVPRSLEIRIERECVAIGGPRVVQSAKFEIEPAFQKPWDRRIRSIRMRAVDGGQARGKGPALQRVVRRRHSDSGFP